ncbi:MAG: IS66 family transposase [Myxococcales bacterium]|nr:IS66 family transposase [Myxococcales bacterium]
MSGASQKPAITSPYAPDLERVRAWLEKKIAAALFVEVIAAIITLLGRMREINLELARKIAHMQRRRPPSETLERLEKQLVLPIFEAPKVREKVKRGPRSKDRSGHPGRGELPAHLRRVEQKNEIHAEKRRCPVCGQEMQTVCFADGCEYLDIIPAEIVVVQPKDEMVRCQHDDTTVSAEPAPRIVEDGKLGDTLLVEAVCDKYLEHVPIERQATRFARAGIDVATQTLGRGVHATIDLLEPIAKQIEECTRGAGVLGTDASAIPILDPEMTAGIRSAAMWVWTNARWVSFVYSPSGDSNSVRRFLKGDFARTVQCDGTSVTSFIERAGGKRPGCWSHGRRRLVEAARAGDQIALEGLRLIAPIFAVERESMMAGDCADARRERRVQKTRPLLDALRLWLDHQLGRAPPKTPLGKALGYLDRQWRRLVLFLEDGNVEATNNRRERELRRLVLGRKNWLFTWGDDGGHRTARVLSVIATAISHDVNPRAYLHLVVRRIVQGWPHSRLRDLLPDRILVAHPELFVGDNQELGAVTSAALGAPSGLHPAH